MRRFIPLLLVALFFVSSCELSTPPPQGKLYTIQVALDYAYSDEEVDKSRPATLYGTINDARTLEKAWKHVAIQLGIPHQNFQFLQVGKQPAIIPTLQIGDKSIPTHPFVATIEEAIKALAEVTTEHDLIIFSYSGHAAEGFITLAPIADTGTEFYDVSQLLSLFATVPGRKLIILDACETGLAIPPSPNSSSTLLDSSIDQWYKQYFTKSKTPSLDLMVMSSSADSESWEIPINDTSYGDFTQALLQGLGWDHDKGEMGKTIGPAFKGKFLTVDMLYSYIKANQHYPLKRPLIYLGQPYQHPMVSGGAVDMILFSH